MKEDLQVFQGGLGAPLDLTADEITAISHLL